MKRTLCVFIVTLLLAIMLTSRLCFAEQGRQGRRYEVTITNLTRGQVFNPPIVMSHDRGFRLFTLGAPVSEELFPLAEDGDTEPLTDDIATLPSLFDYALAGDVLGPGDSVTLEITAHGRHQLISAAGMLVTTNDAFFLFVI